MITPNKNLLLPIAAAIAITACGGGGSPAAGDSTSGKAVDGYLSGSTVFCDTNGNGAPDTGELSVLTDSGGNFSFAETCLSTIAVSGGVDTATGYPFKGLMKAAGGSALVTPLTSLLAESGLTKGQLAFALGLSPEVDVTTADPMAPGNGVVLKKTLAVQQIVQQLANFFGTLTSPLAIPQLYSKMANSLAAALVASPSTALLTAGGEVNTALIDSAIQKMIERVNADGNLPLVALSLVDIATLTAAVEQQTEQFLQAPEANLITLALDLQNPLNPPVESDTAKKNYISPKDNSFMLNGDTKTLSEFVTGVTTNGLTSIGLEYSATGTPQIDAVVDVAMSLHETAGQRILQVKVEQVRVQRNSSTGQVTLALTPASMVHVYARDSAGTSFNASLSGLSFNPLTIVGNAVTVDYTTLVSKIANSAQNNSPFAAHQFAVIQGTFSVKFVVSNNLNVRYQDGTLLPTKNVGIFNTDRGVTGPGITGSLTVN